MIQGYVIWLTGRPAAGKTTIAHGLEAALEKLAVPAELLDGDELRGWLSTDLGFTREDREIHIRRVVNIAKLLSRHGIVVIVALVSPYGTARQWARATLSNYIEVYVRCSFEKAASRDTKDLYRRALEGSLKHFTGVDDPYEEPVKPDVLVDTEIESAEVAVNRIVRELLRRCCS